MAHLIARSPILGSKLTEEPTELIPVFERAIREAAQRIVYPSEIHNEESDESVASIPICQLILKSDANPVLIRDLNAQYISKLVRVPGIVIGASTLTSKATSLQLVCKNCQHLHRVEVSSGFSGVQMPKFCLSTDESRMGEGEKVSSKSLCCFPRKLLPSLISKLLNFRKLLIWSPVGEMPRHILLSADRNLTNKVIPGTRCTIMGVYSIFSNTKVKGANTIAVRNPYVRVVGIQQDSDLDAQRSTVFSEEEEEEFIALSKTPNLYESFANSIAPSIYGNTDIKKAIACLLMSGSKKILPDGMRLRGDINVLMLGDPGTAKSQLLKFVEKVSPIAIYTSGKGSSAAGLTASVQRDAGTREFYLEGGAMVLADGGVVCIDEFDKMRDEDRVAIHEAMEQQTISIAKAGITTILNSRTSVLAAANPIFGRYDDMKSPGENIDFQTTILSRFDMIFIIKDDHNDDRDMSIARHVMNIHVNKTTNEDVGEIPIEKMKRYIAYCRAKCAPRLSPEASEKLASQFVSIRRDVQQAEQDANERSTIPITIRQLEAIIRISESIAKIHLNAVVTIEHVDEAIRLFFASTMDAVGQGATIRKELIDEVNKIESEIKRRLPLGWNTTYQRLVNEFVGSHRFSQHALDRSLLVLERREIIQFRNQRQQIFRSGV